MSDTIKTAGLAILASALLASEAVAAAARKSVGAYTTRNGRAVADAPTASGPAPTAAQAQRDVELALAGSNGEDGRQVRSFGRSFGRGLRRAGGESEQVPPNFTQAGALVRTANPFSYSEAKNATTHTVQASAPGGRGFISIDDGKAYDVGRAPGIRQGPKDTPPPPNPTGGYASGNNSITANTGGNTITVGNSNSGAHDNQNGNSGNNGNGGGNPFGGGTGFDPSF